MLPANLELLKEEKEKKATKGDLKGNNKKPLLSNFLPAKRTV